MSAREPDLDALSRRLPDGVFDLTMSERSGVSRAQLRRLAVGARVQRVGSGLYQRVGAAAPDQRAWILARAARLGADVVVAHESAAAIWSLRTPHLVPQDSRELMIIRTRESFGSRRMPEVRVLPSQVAATQIVEVDGVRVTSLARTALDVARGCRFERALVPLDHASALGASAEEFTRLARYMTGWPGSRVFRPAIAFANPLAESGLESMARGCALAQGLPAPTAQLPLVGASGASYRGDLAWPDAHVILEVDGREKYDVGASAVFAERTRQRDLTEAGWTVVRMTYEEIFQPERTRWSELAAALAVDLKPYDADFGMTVPWEKPRRERRRAA